MWMEQDLPLMTQISRSISGAYLLVTVELIFISGKSGTTQSNYLSVRSDLTLNPLSL